MPVKLPLLALLGFTTPKDGDWLRVRSIQLNRFTSQSLVRTLVNLAAALIVIYHYWGLIPGFILSGWASAVIGCAIALNYVAVKPSPEMARIIDRKSLRRATWVSILLALFWSAPFLYFHMQTGTDIDLIFWLVMAGLIFSAAIFHSGLPQSGVAFILVLGSAIVLNFRYSDQYTLVLVSAMLLALFTYASIQLGYDFIRFKMSEVGLTEKSEVVSLLLREFEESGADWLWQIDASRRVIHVSPRFAFALNCQPSEIEGESLIKLIAGPTWETGNFSSSLHDLAEKLKRRESFSNLMVRVQIGEEIRWWELSASPKLDESGIFMGFRGVGSDVTEQRESADKISHMARFDTLTGLPNRLQLTEALGKAMQDSGQWNRRCAFLMIDLDRFKQVNDTLGHLVGDRLLADVSKRLQNCITRNELCGRLGGDEFAVLIKDAPDSLYIETLAKKVIDTLSRPYEIDHHTVFIGASVGSSLAPRDGQTVEMLIRNADLALYQSKDKGGNSYNAYEPALHARAEERRVMEIALRNALDNNEFTLNFQPIVRAASENIDGFEALLRWNNPQLGSVSPFKFIPLAEETRLIVSIGRWVLETACREAKNWPGSTRISVNVSAEQLCDSGFMPNLVRILSETKLPPERLDIEVTESIFVNEGTMAVDVLDQILALGIGLSLDDFGTGYSSLGYLRKTRFTNIKIDRSFVQGAAKDVPESLAIVRAVVAMADSLGMSTTAEGVENEDEAKKVHSLGAKKIQGYYYGRPMLAEDARALFSSSQQLSA